MPRPRKRFAPADYPALRDHRSQGGNQTTAAELFRMTSKAFKAALSRDERARLFWAWGKGQREFKLVEMLHDPAIKNKTPAIFELKCRHGWNDQPQPRYSDNRVEVTFQIPAALKPDQYRKLLEVTPQKALQEASGAT